MQLPRLLAATNATNKLYLRVYERLIAAVDGEQFVPRFAPT